VGRGGNKLKSPNLIKVEEVCWIL